MASLKIHQSVPLGTFSKIGTMQRKLPRVQMVQRKSLGISATLSISNPKACNRVYKNDQRIGDMISENLDDWMKESMTDIVKNLNQAPLLVQIYAKERDKGEETRPQMIKTEKALMEKWPMLKSEWENGESRTPDGLIFVEELKDDEEEGEDQDLMINENEDLEEGLTKSWGIVVQGKGIEYGPACYLLKTSRVGVGRGIGMFATHFCLVRVKNFRESALSQFNGSWLL